MSRNIIVSLIVLSVLAFAARVGLDFYERPWSSVNALDAMEHRTIAQALVHGHGFTFGDWGYYGPTSVQSPPFPFLLAGMYEIFGSDSPADGSLHGANLAYLAILLINALAGAALVWVTFYMTRTLGGTNLAALIAAGLVAVWPSQIYAARTIQAISLITLSIAAMTVLFYKSIRTGRAGPWVGYSLIAVIATLTEPVLLPALMISGVLILACRSIPFRARLRNAAVLAFVCFAIIGPWAVRNFIVHGKIVPIKGTFWVNVWKGNNEYATGTDRLRMTPEQQKYLEKHNLSLSDDEFMDGPHQYDMLDPSQRARLENQPEEVREVVFKEFAVGWITQHPGRYAELCGIRLVKTITTDWDHPKSRSIINIASRSLLLLLTAGGVFVAWKQRWAFLFPLIVISTALLTYTLTITAARFAIPFEPFQLALGGALIASLIPHGDSVLASTPGRRGFEPIRRSGPAPAPAH
jgi:hypothetical protein